MRDVALLLQLAEIKLYNFNFCSVYFIANIYLFILVNDTNPAIGLRLLVKD